MSAEQWVGFGIGALWFAGSGEYITGWYIVQLRLECMCFAVRDVCVCVTVRVALLMVGRGVCIPCMVRRVKRRIEFLCFSVFLLQLFEPCLKLFVLGHPATYLHGYLADNPDTADCALGTLLRVFAHLGLPFVAKLSC